MKRIHVGRAKFGLLALLLVAASCLYVVRPASAATLTNTYLRLNRMAAGQDSTMRLVFKTVGAGATTVVVNMNGADATTWTGSSGTVSTTQAVTGVAGCDVSATALPGSLSASGSGSSITISGVTALSATTVYCVDLTTANSVHDATAGEYHPTVTVGADSTTVAVRTVTNDQVVVTATVPPTFNLALSGNTDSFASSLSSGSVSVTTGRTVTVNTNAKNGWFAWASDSNTGLSSAAAAHTISSITPGTGATLSAGTEGYLFGITNIVQGSGGGTTSAVAAYNSNGTTTGSGLDTTIREIASSTGTANGAVLTVKELAAISPTTQPATDYTDTITIIGAGYF
ncbi:MAG TPA: hypothetical protein VLH84_02525 [Patescibacteria group bacterium]|nr:hypothetical protein [Patescibacteria group bacterium]